LLLKDSERRGFSVTNLKRSLAVLLCVLVSNLPALAASGQRAGQISALMPAATRNDKPAKAKDDLDWNDVLKTTASGRVRASLTDGSILSLGPNSELKVVQHDAASQQTSLEIGAGQLRSKVVKITQPGGKFQVKTPNAVIGVVGTDCYVEFAGGNTRVICYTGEVWVSPSSGAQAVGQSAGTVHIVAGQTVLVGSVIPPAGLLPEPTPLDLQQSSIEGTSVSDTIPGAVGVGGGVGWHALVIGLVVAGASAGVVLGTKDAGHSTPSRKGCGNANGC
jgi:hypothetical protein